jgi:hypothetical protein
VGNGKGLNGILSDMVDVVAGSTNIEDLNAGSVTVTLLENAAKTSMANFGTPNYILSNPAFLGQFMWEPAPKSRRARSCWHLIGFLRKIEVLEKEHSRNEVIVEDFYLRMIKKKLFTRKRVKEYKALIRSLRNNENLSDTK